MTAEAWQAWRVAVFAFMPGIWLVFSLYYAAGRSGPLSVAWRVVLSTVFVLPAVILLLPAGLFGEGESLVRSRSGSVFELGRRAVVLHGLAIVSGLLVLGNLEQVFRLVRGVMRWRSKFLLLGVCLVFVTQIYTSGWVVLHQEWPAFHDLLRSSSLVVAGALMLWSLARFGLSEAEVYPSNRVILGATATSLAAAYFLLPIGLARVMFREEQPGPAHLSVLMALAGGLLLGIALVSERVRHRAVLFLNRHFRRSPYDYRIIWQTFRDQVTPARGEREYCQLSTDFLSQTFQALSVTIWQMDIHGRLRFGGSTVLTQDAAEAVLREHVASFDLAAALREQDGVLDLDDADEAWRDARGWLSPGQFCDVGGHRLCVPLRAGRELVGVLLLGDWLNAQACSAEELDLLHTLGGEISRGLQSLQQAGQLLDARELQAFQALSSFVVHDLKNTTSTLSLTLQNFRKHHGNPAFREDALRSVSSCVDHLNDIITTLGMLRREPSVRPVASDLNALVRDACTEAYADGSRPIDVRTAQLPRVMLDAVQMKKVLLNLLLNAHEACGPDGRVSVSTLMRGPRRVELAVQDNGCGMDAEFVQTRLFRPFQSTKSKGLGIGLFQSRMIVEAHGGEMGVESQPGRGTLFRVLLPVNGNQP